jgi:hypothetical protein
VLVQALDLSMRRFHISAARCSKVAAGAVLGTRDVINALEQLGLEPWSLPLDLLAFAAPIGRRWNAPVCRANPLSGGIATTV